MSQQTKTKLVRSITESFVNPDDKNNIIITVTTNSNSNSNTLFDNALKWNFYYEGKEYLRSDNSLFVYDIKDENKIIGKWNEKESKIDKII
jgi:hypothetical protein